MAEKKTQSSAKSTSSKSSQQAETQGHVSEEILAKLPESEKKALEELAAAPQGTGKVYKVKDPNTQYVDTVTGWTLAGDQAKELPEGYNSETMARIKDGFLVEADAATPAEFEGEIVAAGTPISEERAKQQAEAQENKGSEK